MPRDWHDIEPLWAEDFASIGYWTLHAPAYAKFLEAQKDASHAPLAKLPVKIA